MTPPLSSEGFRRPIAKAPTLGGGDDWSTIESVIDPFGDVTAPDVRVRAKALDALYPRGYAARRCVNGGSTTADPALVAATN